MCKRLRTTGHRETGSASADSAGREADSPAVSSLKDAPSSHRLFVTIGTRLMECGTPLQPGLKAERPRGQGSTSELKAGEI